jgi:hypothetical protein
MNSINRYIPISITSFITALLFFAIHNQIILFRLPSRYSTHASSLHYYHGNKWKTEKQEMVWSDNKEKNIMHLINAWLALLEEEHIITKKTMLQSALITVSGHAYLSFDHNILSKEEIIFRKWMLIEGLLKTIATHDIAITHVQFLVQHQPLHDAHLDFSLPWPLYGFMK